MFSLFFFPVRYFTLFINLLSKCANYGDDGGCREKRRQTSTISYHDNLHQCTVEAMSNLLSANIDAGLTHAIGKSVHTLIYSNLRQARKATAGHKQLNFSVKKKPQTKLTTYS